MSSFLVTILNLANTLVLPPSFVHRHRMRLEVSTLGLAESIGLRNSATIEITARFQWSLLFGLLIESVCGLTHINCLILPLVVIRLYELVLNILVHICNLTVCSQSLLSDRILTPSPNYILIMVLFSESDCLDVEICRNLRVLLDFLIVVFWVVLFHQWILSHVHMGWSNCLRWEVVRRTQWSALGTDGLWEHLLDISAVYLMLNHFGLFRFFFIDLKFFPSLFRNPHLFHGGFRAPNIEFSQIYVSIFINGTLQGWIVPQDSWNRLGTYFLDGSLFQTELTWLFSRNKG